LFVAVAGLGVRESVVGEVHPGHLALGQELDGDDGLGAFGSAGDPAQLDEVVRVEALS
jgi:hypothetical protein